MKKKEKTTYEGYVVRDRDYLLDTDGNYLRILGDYHPEGTIVSYVKYYPSALGIRTIGDQLYGYNTFVSKNYNLLKEQEDRVIFSDRHGCVMTATPFDKVKQYFSCREKLQQIYKEKEAYQKHPVGKHLIAFLDKIKEKVDLKNMGITGSFLIDAQNEKSDIDLVCYGRETYEACKRFFKEAPFLQRYEEELVNVLYTRRMMHMAPMDLETLIRQEAGKLQGVIRGTGIHINCQPLRADEDTSMDLHLIELGTVSCILQITEDNNSMFAPAIYTVKVESVINSLFHDGTLAGKIHKLLSLQGDFSQVFHEGDRVYVEGKLVRINRGDEPEFAIELSAFQTEKAYKAILLK